ncbi:5-(carboxyamino)imidazole ribonucleotide synthase [Halobaculum sp. MBLA0147]|uniref:5-(carboxyamino)imidazole ribonucleotide synthase n=1 Tax=Halobaculum sp. MBLA0147 TaxID=3079934 RepID=UPI0035251954
MHDSGEPRGVQASSAHTLGVVGGGQLGRMLAEAAAPLGVDVVVVDPTPGCPASRVADQIEGSFDDAAAIDELARRSDAVTVEIELADPDALAEAAATHDTPVHPDPETLRTIRDKLVQTRTFDEAGVPLPDYRAVETVDDLSEAVATFGRVMCKARTGGYDGRGNVPVGPDDDPAERLAAVGADTDGAGAVAEAFVDFDRELSVIGVVGDGEVRTYPPTETIHEDEILRETLVPARTSDAVAERARAVARDVLEVLEGRGVYGIELFETSDGEILLNEVAPRPHNSGHWSIEGAPVSQFEHHVRAVLGLPLGETEPRAPTATANLLGGEALATVADGRPAVVGFDTGAAADVRANGAGDGTGESAADTRDSENGPDGSVDDTGVVLRGVDDVLAASDAGFHWYGKRAVYPLRKVGHVTVSRSDLPEAVLSEARELADGLRFDPVAEADE